MLSYVAGVSEDIRRPCRKFDMKVVFRSGRTLRSMLTKVKDTLPMEKQSKVNCCVPDSLQLRQSLTVYIGETVRKLENPHPDGTGGRAFQPRWMSGTS